MIPADINSPKELKAWFKSLDAEGKKKHGRAFNERMAAINVHVKAVKSEVPSIDPCPGCGCDGTWGNGRLACFVNFGFWQVHCPNCYMRGSKGDSVRIAIRNWNALPR
ncbi:MAG: hypothetical protein P4L67_05030 [Candidatus Pacebacteria bacterium]|nr:hypothetical protein [Candidatus Paceibacterota bacterium]